VLVLGLEVAEEVVEALVTLSQTFNRLVEGLTLRLFLIFDEGLDLFDVADGLGLACRDSAPRFLSVGEEQHLTFLILVLCRVSRNLRLYTPEFG